MFDMCVAPSAPQPPIWLSLYRGNKKAAAPVSRLFYFMEMLKGSLFHIDNTRKLAKYGVNWVSGILDHQDQKLSSEEGEKAL